MLTLAAAGHAELPEPVLSTAELEQARARWVRVPMVFDAAALPASERRLLTELGSAADLIERAYWQQVDPEGFSWRERLARSDDPRAALLAELVEVNAGRYDRLAEGRAFVGAHRRPAGSGFYPADLTRDALEAHLAEHPEARATLLAPHTLVRREGASLRAVPYHEAYGEWVGPAAASLERAAESAGTPALAGYLRQTAAALRSDRWEGIDERWMFAPDERWLVHLAPQRSWLDELGGVKTAYQMSVGRLDVAETARVELFLRRLDDFERRLPLDEPFKRPTVVSDLAIAVVDDVLRAGELARGHLDSRHLRSAATPGRRADGGHLLWRNITEARFEHLFRPKAKQALSAESLAELSFRGYFDTVIAHRVAHALGPAGAPVGDAERPLREVFGARHGALDEAKAEALALLLLRWLRETGELETRLERAHQTAYAAHAFLFVHQSRLPGATAYWAEAGTLAIRWHEAHGALRYDAASTLWSLDYARLETSAEALVREILAIQASGDVARAERLFERHGTADPVLTSTVERISAVLPIQVEPKLRVELDRAMDEGPSVERRAGLTIADLARLRSIREAVVSADGRSIAYTRAVPRRPFEEEDGRGWLELHVLDVAGGGSRPLLDGPVAVLRIAWMPGGERVAFLAQRAEHPRTALYDVEVATGEVRLLVAHDTPIDTYSLSPDGRRVAFLARREPSPQILEARARGFGQEIHGEDGAPTEVWVAELASHAPARRLALAGSASELSWSPIDQRLAVALAPSAQADDVELNRRVHVVDADTGAIHTRLDPLGKLGTVRFSPDARHLALVAAAHPLDPRAGRLWVADLATGGLREVLPGFEGHVHDVAWRDARTLFYLADRRAKSELGRVGIDGGRRTPLLDDELGGAIWSSLSLTADGFAGALLGETSRHPRELFYWRDGEGSARRLTDSNPWLAERRLARQEVITVRAHDGLELDAILLHPLATGTGPVPLVLDVHGGPEEHDSDGWSASYYRPAQVLAACGMAVLRVNYRGSSGRGVAFSELGKGDAGGAEFNDLIAGVEHLAERGLADPRRVGIYGFSYGGFAAAWAATRWSERFAAAVAGGAPTNHLSYGATTSIPEENAQVHWGARPWEAAERYLERSPVMHAAGSRTPLLLLHGEADERVPPGQALELYNGLRATGKAPVRLVVYPGEGHGLNRAAARFDYSARLVRWLGHFLHGAGSEPPAATLDPRAEWADPGAVCGRGGG